MNDDDTPTDEILMAYADGELDAARHLQVEHAMQANPALRLRVDALRQQRARVGAAFAAVLDEPLPERLTHLLQTPSVAASTGPVAPPAPDAVLVNLADARRQRTQRHPMRYMPSWAQLGGMAASIMLGVLLGARFMGGGGVDPAIGLHQGQLVAGGAIGKALSTQLASEPPADASVAVQLSFVDKGGEYCRTFSTAAAAGLACQQSGQWVVQQMVATDAQARGEVRQAATGLPPALLDAVDKRMAHGTLDSTAERTARAQGWRR